jgi:rRNA biogenesis protein RRP5
MVFNRELEISALEERALQGDIPRTPDDFEKLVRSSPNSSFVWIKYMACLLDLADVDKARAVAERSGCSPNINSNIVQNNLCDRK